MIDLKKKMEIFANHSNEVAIGYCDSGCFWHFHWGQRGTGHMMEGFGMSFTSESDDFEEALDECLRHIGYSY